MYAIIANGGKQYKVKENDVLKLEKISAKRGATVEFDAVLMIKNGDEIKIGTPYLPHTKVFGKIVSEGRGDKVGITKFRRRKHYLKRAGHRQDFTAVKITAIGKKKVEEGENK